MSDYEFEEAIQLHSTMLLRLAMSYVNNIYDAQDIVQEVFIKLYRQKNFYDEVYLKRWLIRVTINQCKDLFKRFHKKKVVYQEDMSYFDSPIKMSIHNELKKLRKKERLYVYLNYIEGYTLNEIGELLDVNPNTVSTTIRRAIQKLRLEEDL